MHTNILALWWWFVIQRLTYNKFSNDYTFKNEFKQNILFLFGYDKLPLISHLSNVLTYYYSGDESVSLDRTDLRVRIRTNHRQASSQKEKKVIYYENVQGIATVYHLMKVTPSTAVNTKQISKKSWVNDKPSLQTSDNAVVSLRVSSLC